MLKYKPQSKTLKGKIMASFSKLIEGKTPIINQIIAHTNVSDDLIYFARKAAK